MNPAPAICYTEHAFQRAQLRYGITLFSDDMTDILAACLSGDAPVLRRYETSIAHVVTHKGSRLIPVVRGGNLVITFLPLDAERRLAEDGRFVGSGRAARRREPYRRTKVRLCDLRRGNLEDLEP